MVFLVAETGFPKKPVYYAVERNYTMGQILGKPEPQAGPVLDIRERLGHKDEAATGARYVIMWSHHHFGPYQLLLGVPVYSGEMTLDIDGAETSPYFYQVAALPEGYAKGSTLRVLNMAKLNELVNDLLGQPNQ